MIILSARFTHFTSAHQVQIVHITAYNQLRICSGKTKLEIVPRFNIKLVEL